MIFFSFSRASNCSLRVGRLDFVQLAVHFFVGGQQSELLRPAHEDFVVDQLLQNAEAQAGGLLADRHLVGAGSLVLVVLFHVGPVDLAAIDSGGHIVAGAFGGAAGGKNQEANGEQCNQAVTQEIVYFQIRSSALPVDTWLGPNSW